MTTEKKWWRVLATGDVGNGPVKKTAVDAWYAWDRGAGQCGYSDSQIGTARAACSARVAGFATRARARAADIFNY